MRPFRVFNRVSSVWVIWKVAGVRLGSIGQIAMLFTMAAGVLMVLTTGFWQALAVFATGFLFVVVVSRTLRLMDPDDTMRDMTAFRVLVTGLRNRHTANYVTGGE